MLRVSSTYLVGFALTFLFIIGTLYFTNRKINMIQIMEQQRAERLMVAKANLEKQMAEKEAQMLMEKEKESAADDNADLVFLRKFGRVKSLPTQEELKSMSDKELQYIYHSYLDNTDFLCKRKLRMGNIGDGGWEMCDDYQFRPIKPCLVYSFGISNDFSFDDDVGKVFGCTVYAFDPSMNVQSHKRSEWVYFFNTGISGAQGTLGRNKYNIQDRETWSLDTLTGIKAKYHHESTTLDILKMDIEFAEWSALEDILRQGELTKVRQLLIEFHYDINDFKALRRFLPMLQQLEALGFRRFHTHQNPYGIASYTIFPVRRNPCYELGFVNTRLARDSSSKDMKTAVHKRGSSKQDISDGDQ